MCSPVGPSVPPAVSYPKRGQALSVESDHREEWDGARRLELASSKGDVTASPSGVQERKKVTSSVGVRHAHPLSTLCHILMSLGYCLGCLASLLLCFILIDAVVKGTVFIIFYSDCSLFVYRNATDFSVLVLYPTLLIY